MQIQIALITQVRPKLMKRGLVLFKIKYDAVSFLWEGLCFFDCLTIMLNYAVGTGCRDSTITLQVEANLFVSGKV